MTKEEILQFDADSLYDIGARDFFDDCLEYLGLDDSHTTRMIFTKSHEYAFGDDREDWLEAFEDWSEIMEVV